MSQLELIPQQRSLTEIAPNCFLLPDFLDSDDQQQVLELGRHAREHLGMHRPWTGSYDREGKPIHMKVRVASYGLWWTLRGYQPAVTEVPDLLLKLANKAVLLTMSEYVPFIPETAILQHYLPTDSLGMHRDDSEDDTLLQQGSPIVSLSIGDSCLFRFSDRHTSNKIRDDVELRSGDCVVFGRDARLSCHGVPKILPNTAPVDLGIKTGRLNITMRKVYL